MWHNNSGRGNYASWYCTAIVIRDLQTNEQYEFMCNKWFACEKDDGEIERLVQVTKSLDHHLNTIKKHLY